MKFLAAFILILISVYALGYSIGYSLDYFGEEEVHYHAGFHVYAAGEQLDLSGIEYMTVTPCKESHHHNHGAMAYEASMVHLHDGIGDVIHVHADGQTWGEVFDSLRLPKEDFTQMYRDGVEAQVMDDVVIEYERVVFADAETVVTPEMIEAVPSVERIREVDGMSETCS